jgi:flagellar M-ring protein FliF
MNPLQRATQQFFELYRSMSPSQRGTLLAVPLLIAAGFAALLYTSRTGSETALSFGKVYTTEEVIAAEQALMQAGLTDFRRVGGRILVPVAEVDRYNAALVEFDAMPMDLGSQMLKQLNSMGPFSTDKQRQEMKEAMLLQEMRRLLRAVPGVEDVRVVVANPSRRATWGNRSQAKATVSVKLKGGRELSPKLVQSFRSAVSSMVPDLAPDAVTVVDLADGKSYSADAADDPFDSKLMQRIQEFTRHYEEKIETDLDYIPNVGVTVQVDVENVRSSVTRSQVVDPKKTAPIYTTESKTTDQLQQRPPKGDAGFAANKPASLAAMQPVEKTRQQTDDETNTVNGVSFELTEKALIAAMPKAVQVSVSIPRDYYRDVAAQRKADGEQDQAKLDAATIEKEVLADVQRSVKQLVPADSPASAVVVKSIDRVAVSAPEPTIPWLERVLEQVREWAGAVGLALLAAWGLWTLRKMSPAATPAPEPLGSDPFESQRQTLASQAVAQPAANEQPREPTRRDLIQTIVRDNPELTANVIGKWLQAAK